MSMSESVLGLTSVAKSFPDGDGTRLVLDDVSLRVGPGSMVALTGPSGCGKTTLLEIAAGLLRPDGGVVEVAGEALDFARPVTLSNTRRRHIGLISQDYGLLEHESILDNVTLPLRFARPRPGRQWRREAARGALARAHLSIDERQRVRRLSGGERQRVAIARAIVGEPPLVIADEPTASLDSDTGARIVDLLRTLVDRGAAVLVATHDPQVAEACQAEFSLSAAALAQVR